MMASTTKFDPFAPGFTDNPYPAYAREREAGPVQRHSYGFWLVSGYEEANQLLRDELSVDARNLASGQLQDSVDELASDLQRRVPSLLDVDPPDHTRLRTLVRKAFTPRAVAALAEHVEALTDAALDRIAAVGRCDLMAELASPLPFTVISRTLGMPPSDHNRMRKLAGVLVRSLEPVNDPAMTEAISVARAEMEARIADVVSWKRENPGDDLLTALIAAEQDGDTLTDEELTAQVKLLYLAGYETTQNLIGNGVAALLAYPQQLRLLRERPHLAEGAIEEILRYDCPIQQARRITLAPYQLAGQEIPEGAFVVAVLASANRDEKFWGPDADQLRLDRPNARQHLAFGGGRHHCLGAALARMEGRIAIGRLVQRFGDLHADGTATWNGRINLRGLASLPIAV